MAKPEVLAPVLADGAGFVDTHCHLEMLEDGADAGVLTARAAGVTRMVTIGTDLASSRGAIAFAERYDDVVAAVGVHPHEAHTLTAGALAELGELARHPRVVAIGETGLDWYRDLSPRDDQLRAFRAQIAIARDVGKPVVVHTRDADDDTFPLLADAADGVPVVLHCFSSPGRLDEVVWRGYRCSFAGNVTFPRNVALADAAVALPADLLLTETDSPFLTPVPYRGRTNTPARVAYTLGFLADRRGEDPSALAATVARNADALFGEA